MPKYVDKGVGPYNEDVAASVREQSSRKWGLGRGDYFPPVAKNNYSPGARGGQRDKPYNPKRSSSGISLAAAKKAVTAARNAAIKAGKNKGGKGSSGKGSSPAKLKASPAAYRTTTKKSGNSGSVGSTPAKTTPVKTTPAKTTTSKTTTTNPYLKQAQDAVAAELNPKIKTIKDAQAAYDKSATAAQDKNQARTKQTTHDLKFLYDNLDTKLQSQQAETQSAYANTATKVDANYQALIDKLKSSTTANVDKINSEAERLGLTPPVESRTQADGTFAQDLASTNRQNAALMIAAQGQNNKSTGEFLRQAEQGLGVQTSADFTKAQNNALNQLVSDQQAQDTKFQTDITNLESQRSTMEQQYMQQLEQQAYNRAIEAQQQAFMNQLAVSRFNLSQDTFNANQAYRQAQLALEAQRIQIAAQKATGSSTPTLNYSGAASYINSQAGNDPALKSAMQYAFNTAMQSGEYDFNNKADREKAINGMRAALIFKAPQYNTGPTMQALIQAYDTYLGTYNYA